MLMVEVSARLLLMGVGRGRGRGRDQGKITAWLLFRFGYKPGYSDFYR